MQRGDKTRKILLTIGAVVFISLIIIPLSISLLSSEKSGNVALIPIDGMITSDGANYLGRSTISSQTIVNYIEEADKSNAKVILLEINSPGGTPVGTDEIVQAVKKTEKPVVALIREMGASGGYWVASATDHIIANRMSMTGSIGVYSSYLEFSGMMENYGVGYEQINSGVYKDLGSPFRKLKSEEIKVLQTRIDKLYDIFIKDVALNRGLEKSRVRKLATGEVFLGIEALELGLIDQLGNRVTAETYIKQNYGLKEIKYKTYKKEITFLDVVSGSFSKLSFSIGEGLGSVMFQKQNGFMLI